MNLGVLLAAYAGVGLLAFAYHARRQGMRSAALLLLLWPLLLPFTMLPARPSDETEPIPDDPDAQRILVALRVSRAAVQGTPWSELFDDASLAAIGREVRRIATRRAAIDAELCALSEDRACTQLRQESLTRLRAARDRDRRELAELAEVAELFRAQVVLARHGSPSDLVALRDELWARVQGLDAVVLPAEA
jgi:hypothetical protein